MRIMQINSPVVCGPALVGKWYCSDSVPGKDGDPVVRYLQHDGTWGKTTQYFDSKDVIEEFLKLGHQPDFTVSQQEQFDRNTIRSDVERGFADIWDDERYGGEQYDD